VTLDAHVGGPETGEPRRFPLLYSGALVAELAVLGTLVALDGLHAPHRYHAGYAAVGSFVAMQLYTVRRRIPALRSLGSLEAWLDFHVFLGLQGLILVAYHAIGLAARLDLANADAAVVLALVVTGMIGRYLFRYLARARTEAIWSLLHRPLTLVLVALTTLHVLAHFAYSR
jgi:hypothetical protein